MPPPGTPVVRDLLMVANGEDDALWWYLDGRYIGHDDQYSPEDLVSDGGTVLLRLTKLIAPAGWLLDNEPPVQCPLGPPWEGAA